MTSPHGSRKFAISAATNRTALMQPKRHLHRDDSFDTKAAEVVSRRVMYPTPMRPKSAEASSSPEVIHPTLNLRGTTLIANG
jgi:hypothetical protein